MSKIFLMGHTGSKNRGCEAIVRSTVDILKNYGFNDVYLATYNIDQDIKVKLDEEINLLNYKIISKYSPIKILGKLSNKIFGKYMMLEKASQKDIFSLVDKDDIVMNIGGDTYCYGKPYNNIAANKIAKQKGAKTILWGCSLEKELIDEEIMDDLMRYDIVAAREKLTVDTLIEINYPIDKIVQISDPAFTLKIRENKYGKLVNPKNTIGINMSPIIFKHKNTYNSLLAFISWLLSETQMNIVLIPHVYDIGELDARVLSAIKTKFSDNTRVNIISEFLGCEEIKYIISRCRFFIGARTHATIAAYSCCVPTLVIGYSVKSRGIATDLFGTHKNFVVMVDEIDTVKKLTDAFNYIYTHEEEIKKRLTETIPLYKQKAYDGGQKIRDLSH